MITFLGTGHLGGNFTKALLKQGETVHVWNRTAEKAKALEADGAKVFDSPAEAVKGVKRVHMVVSDDAAVDEVLNNAAPALEPGAIIIDHTTTSVAGAVQRTAQWAAKGYTYIHAPVFMGPINALESTGFMMVSGNQDMIKQVTPWLEKMTGKLLNLGDTTGKAAGIKLVGNLFLISLTGGISDMLALGSAVNITGADIAALFDAWNPGAMTPQRLKRVLNGNFDNPSWELQMSRKDARLMIEEATRAGKELPATAAIAREMDKWIEKGYAKKDWMIVASENL